MNQEKLAIIAWLSPLNFIVRQNDVFSRRREGAGNWLLQSDQFQMWLSGRHNLLWCPGMRKLLVGQTDLYLRWQC